MNRLQAELRRLYLVSPAGDQDSEAASLVDDHGRVRSLVMALTGPADWSALSKVWQGVQVDLNLPAPAIAVSGTDRYQIWFSLSEPLPVAQAWAFLDSLRLRYLSDLARERVGLMPSLVSVAPLQAVHASVVPAEQAGTGHWSAFVAPDLAPVFADAPWLDIPPNLDGQADLLSRLESIQPAEWRMAFEQLGPAMPLPEQAPLDVTGACLDPKRFLLDVMNDGAVALGLRIEAAKALLPYFETHPRP